MAAVPRSFSWVTAPIVSNSARITVNWLIFFKYWATASSIVGGGIRPAIWSPFGSSRMISGVNLAVSGESSPKASSTAATTRAR